MPDTDTHDEAEVEPAVVELDQELAHKLLDAQQAYDEVREYLDEVKAEVKTRCSAHDKAIGMLGDEKVFSYVKRETTRINSVKLKRDYPDIWLAYASTKTTGYLTVEQPKAES